MIGLIDNTARPRQPGNLSGMVDAVFREGGHLETVLGLEHRPEQAAMARSVAASLESDQPLLVEAGTGVGKSLAYLVPGLIHAVGNERPFIVSSHTISLQEQIRNKDLPLCRKLFQNVPELAHCAEFKTALMLGKANYCCTTRLRRALKEASAQQQTELLASDEKAELHRIAEWAATAKEGVAQELSPAPMPEVWDAINADSSTCSRKNCAPDTCFYQRARKKLLGANCVIVNHSLLFSLINAGMPPEGDVRGILLADDFVVLDEAHRIPAIATDHFGAHISSVAVDRALKRLYHPAKGKGVLKKHGDQWDREAAESALHAAAEFYACLGDQFLRKQPIRRLHTPDFAENIVSGPLKVVDERLAALVQKLDDENAQDELRDHRRRIRGYRDAINAFLAFADDDHVHWVERTGKGGRNIVLRGAPLDVAPYLRQHIFSRRTAAVLTSATLTDGTRIEPFQTEVGGEAADVCVEYSPFDYERNCRVLVASDCPAPEPGKGRLDLDYLAEMIVWCACRVSGGTLVLFTSHADLRNVRTRIEDALARKGRPLFAQGHGAARAELTRAFAECGNGVLLGTDSFWTGVDVPGPALSQILITRLPFEHPGHPVSEARAEAIRERGGNPFVEKAVPDALVKFRQGIGRLIRRHDDTGNIVLLDSRILTKPYGTRFLQALPVRGHARFNRHNREQIFG